MKHILCIFLGILSFGMMAQSQLADAIVYSENGDRFKIYLNEELINEDPRPNVKIKGLASEYYMARIDFEDPNLPDFTSKMFAVKYDLEVTYVIKLTKKGYALRYFTERPKEPIAQKLPPGTYQYVEPINTLGDPDNVAVPVEAPAMPVEMPVSTSTTVTTQKSTTTSQKGGNPQNEKVNVNVNMGGVNLGINMDVPADPGFNQNSSSTTTTTTTTTTTKTSGSVGNSGRPSTHEKPHHDHPQNQTNAAPTGRCGYPMDNASFQSAKSSIQSKSFSDSKMTLAKQITGSNCLSAAQIKEIVTLFDFETDRVEYAAFAHSRCNDPQNYFLINDAFKFESSIEELNSKINP